MDVNHPVGRSAAPLHSGGGSCPSRSALDEVVGPQFRHWSRNGTCGCSAKRIVAVDVTGLRMRVLVGPPSTHENGTTELMLEHLAGRGVTKRVDLLLVDRGVTAVARRRLGRSRRLATSLGTTTAATGWLSSLASPRRCAICLTGCVPFLGPALALRTHTSSHGR